MNEKMILEGKQKLKEELGNAYPSCRKELSPRFLLDFANYIPGANEEDYEDYRDYEKDKFASEQWAFICTMNRGIIGLMENSEAGTAVWEKCLDEIVENYFPEFAR